MWPSVIARFVFDPNIAVSIPGPLSFAFPRVHKAKPKMFRYVQNTLQKFTRVQYVQHFARVQFKSPKIQGGLSLQNSGGGEV